MMIIHCSLMIWMLTVRVFKSHAFIPSKNNVRQNHQSSDVIIMQSPPHPHRNNNNIMIALFSHSSDDDDDKEEEEEEDDETNNSDINDEENENEKQELSILNSQSYEFQKAAQNAESDYLQAMLQQSLEFQSIKKNEGSEKACEEFRRRIQRSDEEEASALQSELDIEETSCDDSRDAVDKMWFVDQQKMDMKIDNGGDIEEIREVDDDNVDDYAWQ